MAPERSRFEDDHDDNNRLSPLYVAGGLLAAGGALVASTQLGFTQEVPIPLTGDHTTKSTYYTDSGTPASITRNGVISPAVPKQVEKQTIPTIIEGEAPYTAENAAETARGVLSSAAASAAEYDAFNFGKRSYTVNVGPSGKTRLTPAQGQFARSLRSFYASGLRAELKHQEEEGTVKEGTASATGVTAAEAKTIAKEVAGTWANEKQALEAFEDDPKLVSPTLRKLFTKAITTEGNPLKIELAFTQAAQAERRGPVTDEFCKVALTKETDRTVKPNDRVPIPFFPVVGIAGLAVAAAAGGPRLAELAQRRRDNRPTSGAHWDDTVGKAKGLPPAPVEKRAARPTEVSVEPPVAEPEPRRRKPQPVREPREPRDWNLPRLPRIPRRVVAAGLGLAVLTGGAYAYKEAALDGNKCDIVELHKKAGALGMDVDWHGLNACSPPKQHKTNGSKSDSVPLPRTVCDTGPYDVATRHHTIVNGKTTEDYVTHRRVSAHS